jgi:serine/threonine protein kinase
MDLQKHSSQAIHRLGVGSYSEVFKISIDIPCKQPSCGPCEKLDEDKNQDTSCILCAGLEELLIKNCDSVYAIKQITITDKFSIEDFEFEVRCHKFAYEQFPHMFTYIGPVWRTALNDSPLISVDGGSDIPAVSNMIVTTKPAELEQGPPLGYAYLVTEYMSHLDLFSYYSNKQYVNNQVRPRMKGLLLALLIILDTLHNNLNLVHGDFRDRNIFINYRGIGWKQEIIYRGAVFQIDIGGFEVKLGDFGLVENIYPGRPSFIIRDYEFLENIYCQRENWQYMTDSKTEYDSIIGFIRTEFMLDFYALIAKIRLPTQTNKEARRTFWFNKHRLLKTSVYYYELPRRLLERYLELVYQV